MDKLKELLDELTLTNKPYSIEIKLNFDNDRLKNESSETLVKVHAIRKGFFFLTIL